MALKSRQLQAWSSLLPVLLVLLSLFTPVELVKQENFKTCDESGFCKRNRAFADSVTEKGSSFSSPFALDASSLTLKDGSLKGVLLKTIDDETKETVRLPLTLTFLESGLARLTVDEEKRQKGEITLVEPDSKVRKERYNEAEKWTIVGGLQPSTSAAISKGAGDGATKVVYGPGGKFEAIVQHSPFSIDFRRDGETHVRLNDRGFLNYEHWRKKEMVEKEDGSKGIPDGQETWWDENFGGHHDSKPRGPESIGIDISFPGYEHVYGIPQHTGPMSLRETRAKEDDPEPGQYSEPYRLYNTDVNEYDEDSPMTLYGSIPLMQAHRKDSTVGVFWLNAAETWIDIVKSKGSSNPLNLGKGSKQTQTHWFSESGLLDVFVLLGPTPKDISKTYGELTGYTTLPAYFSIAYHQCRWNYVTDDDVMDVDRRFDKAKIPYDVIWLDIEYTDGKKYFTWDPMTFKQPLVMLKQLRKHDRKLVAIIDPHIKDESNYQVIKELKEKDLAVKKKDSQQYEGWCWPGSSYWIDAFNPAAVEWWKSLFRYDRFTSASNLHLWNDMNEPSVFNGPETTMPKDNIHYDNWEHRDVHNINGMTYVNATYLALLSRDLSKPLPAGAAPSAIAQLSASDKAKLRRPFILTRAFYAGSQRHGAMWTGDNKAEWPRLAESIPMVLQQGISGFPFSGADVGGFFGNPSPELLTRWYQTGIWYPFMRAHAHIETRRREPYLAGPPFTDIITKALRLRYSLLPAWYTEFHRASTEGTPIIRPNWYVHPSDQEGFPIDDQFYVGETGLLVKPVVEEESNSVEIYLGDSAPYYDYFTYRTYKGAGKRVTIDAPLDTIPVLLRGGHIVPRKDRPRRSSGLMKWDPFTLVIALDSNGKAQGELYIDDGETFANEDGAYIHRRFVYKDNALVSEDLAPPAKEKGNKAADYEKKMREVIVEKIVVIGAPDPWGKKGYNVKITENDGAKKRETGVLFGKASDGKASWAVVKSPKVAIGEGWKIEF